MPEIEPLKFTRPFDDSNVGTYGQHGFRKGHSVFRVPAASYMNYFVSTGVVLILKYWKSGTTTRRSKRMNAYDNCS